MSEAKPYNLNSKNFRFETLEDRRVFSGQALTDLAVDAVTTPLNDSALYAQADVTQSASNVQNSNATNYVLEEYGFDGRGQTVAVIDSGIAWDHYALGGGYGENYRVVGGWDFAENDANPYDDGGAGYHGTHVSGIIGSSDSTYRGVSSGVDLVGLRVFDDSGGGNLDWVEQALQWVHEHQHDFENPITTVNLSLGTQWNSDTVPNWATLEDEFAQLELDGIFVSVAAGNAFQNYQTTGLSYPAVSPHVVPVASHGADGTLSDFSQRDERVLVAPGESIKSTVPDHLFGGTRSGAFLGSSGTSMAAPYVAGASTIVRQAMDFMGVEGIDQDAIYQLFRETADEIYDSVTQTTYHRLNLQSAIDAVVKDLHSDSLNDATDIGFLQNNDIIRGTIGKVSDVDNFVFTANESGRVTFDIQSSDSLISSLQLHGATAQVDGNQVSFDIVQGQEYRFSIETAAGIGHYEIAATIVSGPQAVQWGEVDQALFTDISTNGQQEFQFTAEHNGLLTIIAQTEPGGPQFQLYNEHLNLIPATTDANGHVRFDVTAHQGQTFFLKATGSGTFDASISNLISLSEGELVIHGTESNDLIQIDAADQLYVEINSVRYEFDADSISQITVNGGAGVDELRLNLNGQDDQVVLGASSATVRNNQFNLNASNFERNRIDAGGGNDRIRFDDTDGNDQFTAHGTTASLVSDLSQNDANGFDVVQVTSSGGSDTAILTGSSGRDTFSYVNQRARLYTQQRVVVAVGFDQVNIDGGGGADFAYIRDSSGDDLFSINPTEITATIGSKEIDAVGFERINAIATTGNDTLTLRDSTGDDRYYQRNSIHFVSGNNYSTFAMGFDSTTVFSVGGNDVAQLYGTTGADVVHLRESEVSLTSPTQSVQVYGFQRTNVISQSGGRDEAHFYGTSGSDSIFVNNGSATIRTSTQITNRAVGFDRYEFDGMGGSDRARLIGSAGNDQFFSDGITSTLDTEQSTFLLRSIERQKFDGNGGFDVVELSGFEANDVLTGAGRELTAKVKGTDISADNFSFLDAATDLVSRYDMRAVDYLFMLDGDWDEMDD